MKTLHSFSAPVRMLTFLLIGVSLQTVIACKKDIPDVKPQLVHVNRQTPKPSLLDDTPDVPKIGLPVEKPKPSEVTTF